MKDLIRQYFRVADFVLAASQNYYAFFSCELTLIKVTFSQRNAYCVVKIRIKEQLNQSRTALRI